MCEQRSASERPWASMMNGCVAVSEVKEKTNSERIKVYTASRLSSSVQTAALTLCHSCPLGNHHHQRRWRNRILAQLLPLPGYSPHSVATRANNRSIGFFLTYTYTTATENLFNRSLRSMPFKRAFNRRRCCCFPLRCCAGNLFQCLHTHKCTSSSPYSSYFNIIITRMIKIINIRIN